MGKGRSVNWMCDLTITFLFDLMCAFWGLPEFGARAGLPLWEAAVGFEVHHFGQAAVALVWDFNAFVQAAEL